MNAAPENKPPAGNPPDGSPEKSPPEIGGQPRSHTQMSAHDFANWGLAHIAYVRPVEVQGHTLWGVFAANGQQVALVESAELARASLIQNDLEPVSVH